MLTPKRKIAYQICGISMIAMPMIFSIVGILICGFIFYRKKLNKPLKLLENSMEQISNKTLISNYLIHQMMKWGNFVILLKKCDKYLKKQTKNYGK